MIWINYQSLKQLHIVCGTRGFITMITGAPTDSPFCSKIRFNIVLPSVSRLSKWVFKLSFLISVISAGKHLTRLCSYQLLLSAVCKLSCTQHTDNRYVTDLSPYTCQCVLCEDCSAIRGCDSDSYFVFSFIWITWTAQHSSQVLATVLCDVNKEQNHIPIAEWLLLLAIS